MNEARVLQEIIGDSRALDVVPDGYEAFTYSPMENLIDKVLKNYRNFPGNTGDPETVAIGISRNRGYAPFFFDRSS